MDPSPSVAAAVVGRRNGRKVRLGLSHSTVKHHLANERTKVGATTIARLVWILAARLPEPEASYLACRPARTDQPPRSPVRG